MWVRVPEGLAALLVQAILPSFLKELEDPRLVETAWYLQACRVESHGDTSVVSRASPHT